MAYIAQQFFTVALDGRDNAFAMGKQTRQRALLVLAALLIANTLLQVASNTLDAAFKLHEEGIKPLLERLGDSVSGRGFQVFEQLLD